MSGFTFTKAVKHKEKLRLALDGPAGYGKTYSALIIATYLAEQEGGRIAVIDSERSSSKKYANLFDFDHGALPDFNPHTYMAAVRAAVEAGYAVIVIDSFSHAWEGVLEVKDNATARSKSKNSFTEGWREATPLHNELVDTVLRADAHVIATLRTKVEYVIDDQGKPNKIGMKPIQREGVDFEFDVVGDMTAENSLVVSKSRCPDIAGKIIRKPDERFAETLWQWLNDGEDAPPPPPPTVNARDAKKRLLDACDGNRARARGLWPFGADVTEVLASDLADLLVAATSADPFDDDDDPDPDGPGEGSPLPTGGEDAETEAPDLGASGEASPSGGSELSPDLAPDAGEDAAAPADSPADGASIDASTRGRMFALVGELCPDAANLSRAANEEVRKRWLLELASAVDGCEYSSRTQIGEGAAAKVIAAMEHVVDGEASYADFVEGRWQVSRRANGGITVAKRRGRAA